MLKSAHLQLQIEQERDARQRDWVHLLKLIKLQLETKDRIARLIADEQVPRHLQPAAVRSPQRPPFAPPV